MAYRTITLTGKHLKPAGGIPLAGTVRVEATSSVVLDAAGGVVLEGARDVTIDAAGAWSVEVPDPNDTSLNPSGFGYTVTPSFTDTRSSAITFTVPDEGATEVDLASVVPVDPATLDPTATYATSGELLALEASIPTTAADVGAASTSDLAAVSGDVTRHEEELTGRLSDAQLSGTFVGKAAPSDVGDRAGTFDASRSLYLPTPNAIDAVRGKIAAGAAGTAFTRVAWMGTSIVQGYGSTVGTNSPPVTLRKFLERRYGPAGTGIVVASTGATASGGGFFSALDDKRYTLGGTWQASGAPRVNNMQLHVSGSTVDRTITLTSDAAGTVVDIYYYNNSRAFTYSIDGGAPVTVTPPGDTALGKTTITGLANTTHEVTVTVKGSSGYLYLVGMGVRQASGVEVSGFGYYGSITADWLPTAIGSAFYNGYNALSGYNPDVVLVQLGPNELIHNISGGAATVETNLNTIVSALKTAGRQVALVVDPPIESGTVSGWATTYRSAMYDVADAQDVALIDVTHAWRNRTDAAALGYYYDQWHHTPAGAAAMAEVVYAALAR